MFLCSYWFRSAANDFPCLLRQMGYHGSGDGKLDEMIERGLVHGRSGGHGE